MAKAKTVHCENQATAYLYGLAITAMLCAALIAGSTLF
jgi:hypothetical protein